MKTFNSAALQFGFSAVNAGQRRTASEPQVIATSTDGGFRITPAVSKVLGVAHGDYMMFINNIPNLEQAIDAKHEAYVAFCDEQGLTVGSDEARVAFMKEFTMWAVAKGVALYTDKGVARTATERLSKKDKLAIVHANFDELLAAAMESENAELVEALSRDGITAEEQAELLTVAVQGRELPKYSGSKTANAAGLTGVGTSLNFTDSNVWAQLKHDLGDSKDSVNRVYDVDPENVQTIPYFNGYEEVQVRALILGEYKDVTPARASKDDAEDAE